MKNIDMKITEEIAVLSVSGSGYTKEINLVRPYIRPSGWAAGYMITLPTLTGRRRKCFFSW